MSIFFLFIDIMFLRWYLVGDYMTKKVLFTANLESFFTKFLIPQLKRFKENGYEVHIACKLEGLEVPFCDKKYDVNFARSLNLKQIA